MNTGRNSKQTTCLCRDAGGKRTLQAQRTSFNTLQYWGHKTPTQSKKRKNKKEEVKGSWPGTHNTLGYIRDLIFGCLACRVIRVSVINLFLLFFFFFFSSFFSYFFLSRFFSFSFFSDRYYECIECLFAVALTEYKNDKYVFQCYKWFWSC